MFAVAKQQNHPGIEKVEQTCETLAKRWGIACPLLQS